MRIEFVTDSYPPDVNGAAKTISYLVASLRKMGHFVTLIGPFPESTLSVASVRVPKYASVNIGLIRKSHLMSHWQQNRPDVIYIAGEAFLGKASLKAAAALGIPTIAGYHTNYAQYAENWRMGFLVKRTTRYLYNFHQRASANAVPSDSVMRDLRDQGYCDLHVLGRGVDTELFTPAKRSEQLRASWGAGAADPVAMFVSRISPEKNLKLLTDAFEHLKEHNPATRCVVVGDGPSQQRFERENPGFIYHKFTHGEELAEIYASADISVFPSLTETFGNTVTESLASGLVAVAFNYAAAEMHIKHGVNGLLAEYGDETQFLAACMKALDYASDSEFRRAAQQSVSKLSWGAVAERLITVANELTQEN